MHTWSKAILLAYPQLSGYNHYILVPYNTATCPNAGDGQQPGSLSKVHSLYYFKIKAASHEFGHNLGLSHASSLTCVNDQGVDVPIWNVANCSRQEYGDAYSTMGGLGLDVPHVTNVERLYRGWLSLPGNVVNITGNGTFSLYNIDTNWNTDPSKPLMLTLRLPSPFPLINKYDTYALELHGGYPLTNSTFIRDPMTKRTFNIAVFIRMMKLGASSINPMLVRKILGEAGDSFIDPIHKVNMTLVSISNERVTLNINFGYI